MNANYLEVLKMAVGNENEAYEFYRAAAEKAADASVKTFFEGIAKDELKHKVTLEAFLKDPSKTVQFEAHHDAQVSETIALPELTTEMSFKDAVALAMKKEQEAVELYGRLANASADEAQKQLFIELANMERDHKENLENIFINAAYGEVW